MIKVLKKKKLFALKAEIKGYALEAASIRKAIQKSSGAERYTLWNKKRELGSHARHALLAYAFLRNVPYSAVEKRKNHVWVKNSPFMYFEGVDILLEPIYWTCLKFIPTHKREQLTIEQIAAWIKSDVPAFEKAVVKPIISTEITQ